MAKQRSDASRFESRFGGGFVSIAQWLAELACSRKAKREGVTLPNKFWKSGRWEREFLTQLRHANGLLKIASPAAISKALRSPDGKNVYSLNAPWLTALCQDEQRKLDQAEKLRELEPKQEAKPLPKAEPPRPSFVTEKSTLSKLRELDGA